MNKRRNQDVQNDRQLPVRFGIDEYVYHAAYNVCQIVEPQTIAEALSSDYSNEWKTAVDSEYLWKMKHGISLNCPVDESQSGAKVKHGSDGDLRDALLPTQKYSLDYI